MKLQKRFFLSAILLVGFLTIALLTTSNNSLAQTRSSFSVQIASFTTEAEALAAIADLKAKGVEAYLVKSEVSGKGIRFRVRIGKFSSTQSAKASGDKLLASGAITEFAVMPYEPPPAAMIARREPKKVKDQTPVIPEPEKPKQEPAETVAKTDDNKAVEEPKEPIKEIVQTVVPESVMAKPPTPAPTEVGKIEAKPELKAKSAPEPKPEAKASTESKAEAPTLPATVDANESSAEDGEPKIAGPPIPDALIESALSKSNWRMVRRTAETDKNLRAIHFVDSMTGWAAGDAGAVYRTTDGGRSWKPLLSGVSANINFVFFFDWNHGWMIGDSTSKDDDGETVLLSTINGGRTWMIQKIPNLLSVHFTDLQHGWAVGRNATLLRTTNGGTDWKPAEEVQAVVGLPVESSNYNFGFRDVQFLDTDHGWLIGNFYGRAQSNIGGLFVTADSGKTWKRVPLTLETKYVSGRFTPGSLHTVRFTDENTGTVTGEMKDGESRYFFALHTRDGGKTWEQHRTVSRATLNAQFLDPVNGWMAAFAPREGSAEAVVYDTILMRTDNGGMSWQPDFTAKGSRIRSVFFLSPNKGWAVGDRGMILRYEEKTKAMN